ncbi:dihydrofolate reductase [Wohlfahrtiimonas larvae]|uniref:Dihydrofolate reductase n=1 Tax=Wohlfahrtiimonas larvae TaxID=1157986 RepID=A0ABP9MTH8_9GAMM|nr:dihydrofolate reductase [Wohlfahrtiimonas larvae]
MSSSTISLIVAIAQNGTIGINNSLPWHLPDDLAFFKKSTINKPIIMGRKTYESLGRPLPKRDNIVISRNPAPQDLPENVFYFNTLEAAILAYQNTPEVMIIGGAQLYCSALPYMNRLYLTIVESEVEGDTFLPEVLALPFNDAINLYTENHPKDEKHSYPFRFEIWEFPSKT